MAVFKRLPVLHYRADYIFISFEIIELIVVTLKIESVLGTYFTAQHTLLHMKRLNKTESSIFVISCVLCFQRQPVGSLLYYYLYIVLFLYKCSILIN